MLSARGLQVDDTECLATTGFVDLTCETFMNDDNDLVRPVSKVAQKVLAQMILDMALACNVPIQCMRFHHIMCCPIIASIDMLTACLPRFTSWMC